MMIRTEDVVPSVPRQASVARGSIRADLPTTTPEPADETLLVNPTEAAANSPKKGNRGEAEEACPSGAGASVADAPDQLLPSLHRLPSVASVPCPSSSTSSPQHSMPAQQRGVHKAVTVFVKQTLIPLYKAGVIDKAVFKQVASKSVAKVMVAHAGAEDAGFLVCPIL